MRYRYTSDHTMPPASSEPRAVVAATHIPAVRPSSTVAANLAHNEASWRERAGDGTDSTRGPGQPDICLIVSPRRCADHHDLPCTARDVRKRGQGWLWQRPRSPSTA